MSGFSRFEAEGGLRPITENLIPQQVYHGSSSGSVVLIGRSSLGTLHRVEFNTSERYWMYVRSNREGEGTIVDFVLAPEEITDGELRLFRDNLPGGSEYDNLRIANSTDFLIPEFIR